MCAGSMWPELDDIMTACQYYSDRRVAAAGTDMYMQDRRGQE